jgi:hypothetical protein
MNTQTNGAGELPADRSVPVPVPASQPVMRKRSRLMRLSSLDDSEDAPLPKRKEGDSDKGSFMAVKEESISAERALAEQSPGQPHDMRHQKDSDSSDVGSDKISGIEQRPSVKTEGKILDIEELEENAINQVVQTEDDTIYAELNRIIFERERFEELAGKELVEWIERLQGALGLPYETVLAKLVSASAFQLHRTTAQYTKMLSIPPMPWISILGRPGDAKSIAIWFLKQAVLELQRRANESVEPESNPETEGEGLAEQPQGGDNVLRRKKEGKRRTQVKKRRWQT